ncbi:DNA double-strand break repair nuclease NurA [Chloroflexota bacterium]
MSPLYADRVLDQLEAKSDSLQESQESIAEHVRLLLDRVQPEFTNLTVQDIDAILAAIDPDGRFGARPTSEQEEKPFIVPFQPGCLWTDHQSTRAWAADVLTGVTTYAVDGSMIYPDSNFSVPIGLVQIGWFQNDHTPDGDYVKDVAVEILSAADWSNVAGTAQEEQTADKTLRQQDAETSWRRYKGEVQQAIKFMQANAGRQAVVFLDGTLTISFVRGMVGPYQQDYHRQINELMAVSERTRIPVVGYVDASRAVDFVTLLWTYHLKLKLSSDTVRSRQVTDAGLLRSQMVWGERCRTYICNRDDDIATNAYYDQICFTYLKTTGHNPPARLEIPRWVFEDAGLYEWVLDIVRAECIVGLGYPYALETADAVAVLTGQDRERFYRLFQEFAGEKNIEVRLSRKSTSKRGRRV